MDINTLAFLRVASYSYFCLTIRNLFVAEPGRHKPCVYTTPSGAVRRSLAWVLVLFRVVNRTWISVGAAIIQCTTVRALSRSSTYNEGISYSYAPVRGGAYETEKPEKCTSKTLRCGSNVPAQSRV